VLTFEPHPREFLYPDTAPSRLTSLRDKLALLREAGADRVYVARFDHALANLDAPDFVQRILVEQIAPRRLMVGDDFLFGRRRQGNIHLLRSMGQEHGWDIAALNTYRHGGERVSSTRIRRALLAGDLALAATLLGRPYLISARVWGKVSHGGLVLRLDQSSLPLRGRQDVKLAGPDDRVIVTTARLAPHACGSGYSPRTVIVDAGLSCAWRLGERVTLVFTGRRVALADQETTASGKENLMPCE
jgi:riboflavin kinase/FMN adenylyltransferase